MKYIILLLSLVATTAATAQTKPATVTASGEPAGIDPGIAPAPAKQQAPSVYQYVQQMPSPGYDVNNYIARNIQYPKDTVTQGRVYVEFIVNDDGSIGDARVVKGLAPAFDKEALRVISSMPKWKPGKQNGKAVRVRFTQPITFRY